MIEELKRTIRLKEGITPVLCKSREKGMSIHEEDVKGRRARKKKEDG